MKTNWQKVVDVVNGWTQEKRQASTDAVMADFAPMQSAIRHAVDKVMVDCDGFRAAFIHAVLKGWMAQIEARVNSAPKVNEVTNEDVELTLESGQVRKVHKVVKKEVL